MQLVVNSFGAALRRQGDRFLVRAGDRQLAVSAHKVQSILVATAVSVSSDALQLAVEHNIDVIFLDRSGDPYGRVWQHRLGSTAAIRHRQLEVAAGPEGLELVRGWVEAKLRHQHEFLTELAARRPSTDGDFRPALSGVTDCLERLRGLAGTLDERRATVMGLEGAAGRAYFACLSRLVPEAYRFEGRSRHPAKDGFNALLNYTYGVLYSLVERACVCAGLDPFVGFLHTDNYGKQSLVFDLIEPFRILGDRTALLLFTGRRARADYFEPVPGSVALTAAGPRVDLLEIRCLPTTVQLAVASYFVNEGYFHAYVAVRLSSPSAQQVTVDLATSDGTTTSPADYRGTNQTVTFAPGSKEEILVIPVVADQVAEANGTFHLTLSNPVNAPLRVAYGLGGEATPGVDYQEFDEVVEIPAGSAMVAGILRPINDELLERSEWAELTIIGDDGYEPGDPTTARVKIKDNDASVWPRDQVSNRSEAGWSAGNVSS